MAVEVVMPKLGMAMKEGTVSIWNKRVGDPVGKGEPIASVNSEKIEIDVESPAEGTLLDIAVPEGQGVPPGTVICYIGNSGEAVSIPIEPMQKEENNHALTEYASKQTVTAEKVKGSIKISPVARKIAEAARLDINKITGTGPGGRITKEDVQQVMNERILLETEKPSKPMLDAPLYEETVVSGMRKVIAKRMYSSLQNSAQLTINMKVDVTNLIELQKQLAETIKSRYESKLTLTDFIARAVVLSLLKHKQLNSAMIDDKIQTYHHIHLGMAVALDNGLVVPVIQKAEELTLMELSGKIKDLARKAREGKLLSEDMKGSTFTITNLGAYGVDYFTPILNPPEAGILGVCAVYDSPVFIEGQIQKRSFLPLSLTFDHRVVDGAPAAIFLQTVKSFLEEPITMLV